MPATALTGGFADPAIDAAHAFREIMTVMARPGHIATISGASPPAPLSVAAGIVALTLCDTDTPLFLGPTYDSADVRDWITFHTGAPFCGPDSAMFALGAWDDLPLHDFPIGTPEYPDRSVTLIVEQPKIIAQGATLRGPGIDTTASLNVPNVLTHQMNHARYPLGFDVIFTSDTQIAALPRTTQVS